MIVQKTNAAIAAFTLAIGGLACQPAAAALDKKSISPSECMPRGPDTTIGELTYGPYGITNPGSSNESVICPINGDSDASWSSTAGTSAYVYVHYRIGAVAGNVSCSAFAGTSALRSPTYSVSASSGVQSPGYHDSLYLPLAEPTGAYYVAAPSSVVCTIPPKAALVWIYFIENLATDTP